MIYDVAVIGGSYAGLSAAMYAARGRRTVAVVDAGAPRNRFSPRSHGFFGQDGEAPDAMIGRARSDLARYASVRLVAGRATGAVGADGAFAVTLDGGERLCAAKLVLAFGVTDELPDVPGLRERWGRSVLHCPYCHGFEHAGRPLGVLAQGPGALHHARLIANWGPTTLFLAPSDADDAEVVANLEVAGVAVERAAVVALAGQGDALASAELSDGRRVPVEALFVVPKLRLASPLAAELGCALADSPAGSIVRVDGAMRTSVPGVYACGDAARAFGNAMLAAADGVVAGGSLNYAAIFGEPARA